MEEITVIGIDLAKCSFSGTRGEGGRVCGVPPEAEPRDAGELSRLTTGVYGGDGGLRRRALLGPGNHRARSRRNAGAADLREAVRQEAEERHGRRGGDHGSGAASDHALRGHLAEYGVVAPQGWGRIGQLAELLEERGLWAPGGAWSSRNIRQVEFLELIERGQSVPR